MAFSSEIIAQAWLRAQERCECTRKTHNHYGRCIKELILDKRGREGYGAWEAHHRDSDPENNSLSNCEILCWDCHKKTLQIEGYNYEEF